MEISSHYYALLALCRTCGINKETSHKIAYASQFVDDAKINCLVADDGFHIYDIATCHSYEKIRTFNYQAMMQNTVSFHFPPGCEGDVFTKKLVCTENSPIINQIINEEISSEPEVFGMLMHIYADTFAHQGFSGLLSKENDIEELKNENLLSFQDGIGFIPILSFLGKKLNFLKKLKEEKDFDDFMPAYGHGQAEHFPDIPYLDWSYEYTHDRCVDNDKKTVKVNNVARFKSAFESIQKYLELYLEKNNNHLDPNFDEATKKESMNKFFEILKARERTKNKIKMWQNFIVDNGYYNKKDDSHIITYDEKLWIKELIKDYDEESKLHKKRTVKDVKLVEGYENTSWLKFVAASKVYKARLAQLCEEKDLIFNS